jgi:hypothetical protein
MSTMRSDFDPLQRIDYETQGRFFAGAMPVLRQLSGEFSFMIAATAVYGVVMAGCALAGIV